MARVAVLLWLVLAGVAAAQQANAPRFTGKSDVMDGKDLTIARRHFDPGARTFWHSHDKGQLLLVEQGRMRAQKKGQPARDYGVGDTDYTPPDVQHWHGAGPDGPLVQINAQFGGATKWFAEVTDAEYAAKR